MLSVIIIAKNEEANIARCLESVRFANEIIVLDSGSTDKTMVIAKQHTDQVFLTDWHGYGMQKQRALAKASGDWVLNLDADESVTPELQEEIKKAMNSSEFDAYRLPIKMVFYGKVLRYSSSPKRHVRLFKRAMSSFNPEEIIHEKVILADGTRIGKIKAPIMHHSYQDVSHVLYKINKYSSYSAKSRLAAKPAASFIRTICSTLWMFARCYLLQFGFLDGREGFLFAIFNAQGTFYRGVKQLYLDHDIDELPNTTIASHEVEL